MRVKLTLSILAGLVLLALIIAPLQFAWAGAPPATEWDKTFGGTGADRAFSVQQTVDAGYIMAGGTTSNGAGGEDAWLIKTDSSGNKTWDKTFGDTGDDLALSVQQTADGGYVLAGWTESYGAGAYDAWLIKTDSSGNKTWDKTFGGTSWEYISSVRQTADGGYVLSGETASFGAGGRDAWLIKTDPSGIKTWDRTFGGTSWDYASSVRQTSDGGYVLSGGTQSFGAGDYDAWLIKTDSSGNETWDKTFGGTRDDQAYSVQQTADGGYVLSGHTVSYGVGNEDAWLIKADSSGNKTWDKTFGGTFNEEAWSVQQTGDGGYVLAGPTDSYGAGNEDAWLIKLASGTPLPITSITPKTGVAGSTVNVTNLAGAGFQLGASVRLELGATVVNATNVNVVSDRQITCKLVLPGTIGKYDVVVENTDGQEGRLIGGFSVTNACGQGAGAAAAGVGLVMGLLSLGGSGLLRRRPGRKSIGA
jgi:hypothetical protein